MKNSLLSIFISSCLSWVLPCYAISQEAVFTNINEQFGISMRETTAMVHDDYGFIWVASRTGVLRITANDYRLYELPFITTDVMQVKMACRGNLLVVVTQNGQIFRYNRVQNSFDRWGTLSSLLNNEDWITNLLIDGDGKVWISTSVGVFIWTGKEAIPAFDGIKGISYITHMDSCHILAFAQSSIYNINTLKRTQTKLRGHFPYFISTARYDTYTNRVWIGTYDAGLWQYDFAKQNLQKSTISQLPKLIVRDIMIPDTTSLWVGIDGGGIWILDKEAQSVQQILREDLDNPSSLRGNSVYSLLMDKRRRVWAATNSGGLQYTETAQPVVEHLIHGINNAQSLHNNQVNHMLSDSRNNLWIATDDGISRRNARTHEWEHFYKGSQRIFLSLATDNRGHIFAGTYGEGLYILDETTGRELRHFTARDGKLFGVGSFLFAAYTDNQGDIWLGGVKDKVYCYHSADGQIQTYDMHSVYCFAELQPGQILLGCAYGLLLMDKKTGKFDVLLSKYTVHDIAVIGHMIWVCTSGNGIIGLDMRTAKQTHITTQKGLPSNYTKSLLVANNALWIGTNNGLCSFNPQDNRIQTFANHQQLTNVPFGVSSACKLSDGRLAFGSNNGAIIFHPDELDTIPPSGRIYFSDIRVAGRSIRQTPEFKLSTPIDSLSTLCLRYPQNSFTLSVLPLGDISKSATFSWKLEGQDNEWSAYTTNQYINYINLPAGDYTLCIRLYDGCILSEREMFIKVEPPFWETAWFRLLMVVVIIGILILTIRYYVQRLHRRYTDEKIRFFTSMAHDIRTSLMLIKAPVEELRKESNLSSWGTKCLSLASEQVNRLADTATQLLDFEKLDIGREQPIFTNQNLTDLISRRISVHASYAAGQQITILVDLSPENYWTQVDVRMMERIIDNLLTNAVKYSTAGGRIEVTFVGKANEWTLRVKDYGMGISQTAQRKLFREFYRSDNAVNAQIVGSGIGLLMTKKYIAIHGGKITVTSELNKGTAFDIIVPLRLMPETKVADNSMATNETCDTIDEVEASDMHILIVEDNRALRDFMVHPLREHFHVTTANDGQQAWEIISDLQPDLVVSDVVMPRMDGFELCKNIKSTYETSHIPVILLTALSDKTSQLHGLGLGADNYLVKPFDMALLTSRITSIIRNRRTVLQKTIEVQRDDARSIVTNRINDEFIKKAISCVRTNIANENFGKEDFASALALSQSLLYKKIKALTNLSVVEFIREIRLNYAMELLRSGEFNVTEVSEMCGFNTSAYFSKVFKEFFGKTPTEVM